MLTIGAVAVAVVALLLARPAAAGLFMMIFIMTGLPALYRLRRYARAPRGIVRSLSARADVRRGVPDGRSGDDAAPGRPSAADGDHRSGTQALSRR
jgi:hypothetical protein